MTHSPVLRRTFAVAASVVAAVSLAGPASAKESAGTFSIAPGVVAPTGTCSPVQSFKTDYRTGIGDTGLSSISADYAVKPCDSKQVVTVAVLVVEAYDPTNVLRDDPAAPLSDKFDVVGVKLGTNYRITITVTDAVTGATVGQESRLASAPFPTGV